MSSAETLVLLACLAGGLGWFGHRTYLLARVRAMGGEERTRAHARQRLALGLAVPANLFLLLVVLLLASSRDVRTSPLYTAYYMSMGLAWLSLVAVGTRLMGLDVRGDSLERANPAATAAAVGAQTGGVLSFAGGNVGDGPGWSVVVFCGVLSTGGLFVLWYAIERLTRVSDAVTVDRDLASGLRLAAFLAAGGLVLGRAVAGDWTSFDATIADYVRLAWPAVVLALLAVTAQRVCGPTPRNPAPGILEAGLLPAALLFAISAWAVWRAGPWW